MARYRTTVRTDLAPADSFAFKRALSRFGIAMAAIMAMIATIRT